MQRGQRDQPPQILQTCRRDDRRTGVLRAAMHDAMADAADVGAAVAFAKPSGHEAERGRPSLDRVVQRGDRRSAGSRSFFAENRGLVPIPSICPRAATDQASPVGR